MSGSRIPAQPWGKGVEVDRVLEPHCHLVPAPRAAGEFLLLSIPGTWGSESGSLSMALASKGPIGSWSPVLQKLSGQAHPVLPRSLENTQLTLAHAHVHADVRRTHTQSGGHARSVPLFSPLRSSSMVDCPRVPLGRQWGPVMECAHGRGPEEVAPVHTTHPTGIWVHCDKGHETWPSYKQIPNTCPTPHLDVASL